MSNEIEQLKKFAGNAPRNLLHVPKSIAESEHYVRNDSIEESDEEKFRLIASRIKHGAKVLDVGCSTGALGKLLSEKGCDVFGMDIEPSAAEKARTSGHYEQVSVMDLETSTVPDYQARNLGGFDYIVCADILEHLKNSSKAAANLLKILKTGGEMIVSIPNLGNIDIIYNLIRGRFNYNISGILDRTHLRFFTGQSFAEWITNIASDQEIQTQIELFGRIESTQVSEFSPDNQPECNEVLSSLIEMVNKAGKPNEIYCKQFIFAVKKA